MPKRVYIAGPMRSVPYWNWPAFDAMAERLRVLGFDVVNPAQLDREAGIEAPEDGAPPPQAEFDEAMSRDLAALKDCDAIALLDGWQDSEGAKIERDAALYAGLMIYRAVDIERMERKTQHDVAAADGPNILDDGARRHTATGAQRDARSGKGRYDLLPPEAIRAWAKRMEDGAAHYGDRNWEKGMNLSWFLDSALRHLMQVLEGDETEDHAAAVLFNVGGYIAGRERIAKGDWPAELDDLPSKN